MTPANLNRNTVVLRRSGDGMSCLLNELVKQQTAPGGTVVIIDRGQSHAKLLRALQDQTGRQVGGAWYRRFGSRF